ncbi:MAG: PAS domain S-box protein [Campylobacterota bacterium]|nr:PAS domain S-box protein [Campylobacterota bacterium]
MPYSLENLSKMDLSLLTLLTKHLPDMLWIKDINGKYIYANKAICDRLLMAEDVNEPIGKGDVFFALREREKYKDIPDWHTFGELCFNSDQVVIDANKPMKFEEYGNVKGKLFYLEVNKAPFYDDDGNIIGTVGSGRDITELKMTQFKLSQQAQIIEQIHDCIITTDIDGKIVSWNRSAQKLFGYDSDFAIDKNIDILFTPEDHLIMKDNIEKLLESEEHNSQINFVNKENDTVVTDLTLSLLKDTQNNIIRIIYYIKDITEKEKLNKDVKKQECIITQQANHVAMGEMIGNIAHQWRQPLSSITAASSGMQIEKEYGLLTDEKFYKNCELINKNAVYLSDTINDFRNFIKGDRKKVVFELKDNITSFLHLVDGAIKSNHINLVLDLQENIKIDGYANELIQCFINIFNNSSDALKENIKNNRLVFIKTSSINEKAIITIKDNAGGIPENLLAKVFEPYFTTKQESKGTGLGLSMTYKIVVDGMVGTIVVKNTTYEYENKKYRGAEFDITLPLS